ncbi:hypothetical protein [Vibrio gangliei]|uniref:hypothetical protein n=1 Tax=Vibrio gangliei TaxID=2077090 RepID=UPI000D020134|nr:hypothetical protein [Vibrio gangliei]
MHQVLKQNLHASQQEDVDAYMATMHTQSLVWTPTKHQIEMVFDNFDLTYQLDQFDFVAQDDEYAYAKIWMTKTKISGGQFKNNRVQALVVFKQENGAWKVWSQANMQIKYLD